MHLRIAVLNVFPIYETQLQLQRNRKQKIIISANSADWRNIPELPSLRPDVVPSSYQQENSSAVISKRQFQHAVLQLYPEGTCRIQRISSGTQTSFLDIPITSQLRPVIIQSQADTHVPPLTSEEIVKISVDTQTMQVTNLVSAEDKGLEFNTDTSRVTNTAQTTESTQTDSLVQVSMEIQTEELLTITKTSQIDIPKKLQTSASSQTIPEELHRSAGVSKEPGTSVSTQTVLLEAQTVSTETKLTEVASVAMQAEESLEKELVVSSNSKTSSEIQKNIVGSAHQPSQLKSHLPLLISSNVPEDDNSTSLPTLMIESDISLEEFTEVQISVGTQTDCSSPFLQAMVSPMRQFQFSVPTVFPPGSLLSRSSPMTTLLMPLGMICFQAIDEHNHTDAIMQKHIFSSIIVIPI